jgi:plasmid maintenance system antidote protein VapI
MQQMTPLERQFELRKLGIKQYDIANEIGVHEMSVSKIINDTYLSDELTDKVTRSISKKIGKHPMEVFPNFYTKLEKKESPLRLSVTFAQ